MNVNPSSLEQAAIKLAEARVKLREAEDCLAAAADPPFVHKAEAALLLEEVKDVRTRVKALAERVLG